MSVSFCLPHPVAVSAFMICRGLCACTEMLWMCVLYVSFGSKVRPRTFGCVAMGSALLFIVRSRLLVYSAGSGVNRVQVVLSGFSKRLFCFVQAKTLCRYGCMYFLATLVLVCVDAVCANGMTDFLDKCPVKETFLPDISRFYWTLSQSFSVDKRLIHARCKIIQKI